MSGYRELTVYERSYKAALEIYRISSGFPKDEVFGLTSQIKRAATSIPLNIAEGYGKQAGNKELVRFLQMALGSNAEVEVLLSFAKDFGYISEEECGKMSNENEEIGKMLNGLIKSVKARMEEN